MKPVLLLLACMAISIPFAHAFDWESSTPEGQGIAREKLDAVKDGLAQRRTKAFLVIRHDRIIYEWYAAGHGADQKHYTASMAKALVAGMATGVALTDGLVKLDDPAANYVTEWKGAAGKSKITLRQLGSHTSGIEDAESGKTPHDQLTGWKGTFWKPGPPPMDSFTVSRDMASLISEPGKEMHYSNPGIAMLTYCITAALRHAPQKDVRAYLRDRVMRPIGVADGDWSVGYGKTDTVDGLPLIGSWGGANYTARATARVGGLMLREGNWDGKQILSKEAVHQVTRDVGTPGSCAIGWWSNNDGHYAKVPKDAFWGSGAGHQVVLVIPSLAFIAVRNGAALDLSGDYDKALYENFLVPLMGAMQEQANSTRGTKVEAP